MTQDTEDVVARFRSNIFLSSSIRGGSLNHLEDHEVRAVIRAALEASERQSLSDRIDVLEGALKPFADCVDQIAADEDDEEWAKFRLLIKDYRRAAAAFKRPHFERCPTCGGEFDEGEWNASSECPECETPIARAALHQEGIAPK